MNNNEVKEIIEKYFGERVDKGGGTIGYVFYPHIQADDIVSDLWAINKQLLQLKKENEKLKEQHKWDKKREQFNGGIMWGKDEHNNKCLEDLFGTLMERNTTTKDLIAKLEKARGELERVVSNNCEVCTDKDYCEVAKDETCLVYIAQQALKELE